MIIHQSARRRAVRGRTSCAVGTVAMALLALAACGGSSSDGGSTTPSGSPTSGEASSAGAGGDPINVVSIIDETGPLNIYGAAMADATKLAIADINSNGGVLGRQLNLIAYDAQSDNAKYTQYANQAVQRDGAAVVMAGITSASREAIRPLLRDSETLYFYNEQYEGGVCDINTINTGVVPSQQLAALIPYAIDNFGPKLYTVAADYNYGQISALWVEEYAVKDGGEVVKTQFIPLDVSDFGAVINDLQALQPDAVVSLLVGGNHIAFYRQFYAAGLQDKMQIVSATFGLGNEQVVLTEEAKGITVAYPYFQELDNPANAAFLAAWRAEFGDDYAYVTDSAVTVWNGWHLWADAVNQAGTLDRVAVLKVLDSDLTIDSPSGTVVLDGSSRHVTQNVSIAVANGVGGFDIIETAENVPPSYEQSVCDLVINPDINEQFTP